MRVFCRHLPLGCQAALTTVDLTQLPATQVGSDEKFDEMSRSNTFLGRLQLYSKGAAIDEGLIPPGTYGIPESDKKITNLGNSIDILPLAKRPKALDLSDKSAIIANYDAESETFIDIASRSENTNSNCMYGTSFLVYEKDSGRFLEFFCGTKSTRPLAGDIAAYMALTQADIDRKKKAGADVSKMEPHGPRFSKFNWQKQAALLMACARCVATLFGHLHPMPSPARSSLPIFEWVLAGIAVLLSPGATKKGRS